MAKHEQQWVERILRVLDHIQVHLDEELSPEQLAEIAGFSRHHFHRVFTGMMDESVMGFVRRLRLERAAMRLKFGEQPVTQVAFSAGYNSHEAFTRAFRQRFAKSPSSFRQQAEQSAAPAPPLMSQCVEPDRDCLAYRFTGPYEDCLGAWEALIEWSEGVGVYAQRLESLGLVYDDPQVTKAANLRYDACLVLPPAVIERLGPLPAPLVRRKVPGGRYAMVQHRGAYEGMDPTYAALLGYWLPRSNVELCDEPVVERYLNRPMDVAPYELLTDVCVRLDELEG